MKKIILGLVAAFALTTFAAPVFADDAAGGDTAAKSDSAPKAKKKKKSKKSEDAAAGEGDAKK
jgi:hypothetical protein